LNCFIISQLNISRPLTYAQNPLDKFPLSP